ncbi:hypothetical protein [Candidatus Hydrogenosomobacter endosymbioticus]|uniref:Uncharacterized protein n=1 Tax=Candidatus Hydrogenosomobacter endosymbioticus TaxID=2558174 RepID=A0ABM7V9Q7_9PROT|nr:hypothetical protein [Candidatus Hydrogenosomobacter endosymbioticus]BDB96527.1 hypothetical protein HYD_6600 [Candidatus Hydrogenosomobacter endosymbioticus]
MRAIAIVAVLVVFVQGGMTASAGLRKNSEEVLSVSSVYYVALSEFGRCLFSSFKRTRQYKDSETVFFAYSPSMLQLYKSISIAWDITSADISKAAKNVRSYDKGSCRGGGREGFLCAAGGLINVMLRIQSGCGERFAMSERAVYMIVAALEKLAPYVDESFFRYIMTILSNNISSIVKSGAIESRCDAWYMGKILEAAFPLLSCQIAYSFSSMCAGGKANVEDKNSALNFLEKNKYIIPTYINGVIARLADLSRFSKKKSSANAKKKPFYRNHSKDGIDARIDIRDVA